MTGRDFEEATDRMERWWSRFLRTMIVAFGLFLLAIALWNPWAWWLPMLAVFAACFCMWRLQAAIRDAERLLRWRE